MPISRERLFLGHSLRSNKIPVSVPLKVLDQFKPQLDLESLGLFDSSSPDFNKYYPDVDAKDLNPKDEDYAFPVFRALSEIIVNKWGPVDFTNAVLKPSMKKLMAQAVYTNHEQIVGNEVGVVYEVFWEKAKEQDGFEIPAGINVRLKLDGKSNPKLVRSINSDPPSVHSVSVTIAFKWEKSHPELSDDQFWSQVGTYTDKGELIRRMVTEVFSYEEISLVPHGADPYAQKINDDGKLNNPAYADNHYQFSAEEYSTMGHHFDWKNYGVEKLSMNKGAAIPTPIKNINNSTQNDETMNKELLEFLRSKLGLAANTTEAQVIAELQSKLPILIAAGADVTRLTGELTTANSELSALKTKYPEGTMVVTKEEHATLSAAKENQATATAALTGIRAEVLKLYHLTVGGADKADASLVKLIGDANYDTATALLKQYEAAADKEHALSCEDCGSKKVSRASAAAKPEGDGLSDDDSKTKTPKVKTNAEVMAEFAAGKNLTGNLYPEVKK